MHGSTALEHDARIVHNIQVTHWLCSSECVGALLECRE